LELEHRGLRRRWDILKFEVDAALSGVAPSGQSIMQRLAFWQAGWYIFQHSPAWGVGTGDLNSAFDEAYKASDSQLAEPFRLRAHNQFLSFALAGGPVGAILFVGVFIAMIAMSRRQESEWMATATLLFVLIFFLSCWTEDTLETQAGVTWAGFFTGLLGRRLHG
jgi:O-antigen ligase